MKLYFFSYMNRKMKKWTIEVEEKQKTYKHTDRFGFCILYNKADVGRYIYHTVFLVEDDVEKAKEVFAGKIRGDKIWLKSKIFDEQEELREMEIDLEILEKGNFEIESEDVL